MINWGTENWGTENWGESSSIKWLVGDLSKWHGGAYDEHYATEAFTLSALSTYTLTAPLTIVDLDGTIPNGTFLTSKDGFAITVQKLTKGNTFIGAILRRRRRN